MSNHADFRFSPWCVTKLIPSPNILTFIVDLHWGFVLGASMAAANKKESSTYCRAGYLNSNVL